MRLRISGILIAIAILSAPLGAALGSARIVHEDASSLDLWFDIKGLREVKDGGGSPAGLSVPGFAPAVEESLGIAFPVTSCLVAIPVGARVSCRVVDPISYEPGDYDPGKLARLARLGDVPGEPAEITASGYMGNQRVACLRISPLVYDDATGRLRVYTGLGVRLDFAGATPGATGAASEARAGGSALEENLRGALVNYAQGRRWRRASVAALASGDYFDRSSSWIKMKVKTTGVYCVTGQDLAAIGVSIGSIDTQTLRIYTGSGLPLDESLARTAPSWMKQVPIRVSRPSGSLAGGDSVVFYALGWRDWADLYDRSFAPDAFSKNFYSNFNCYWLTWGGTFSEDPARVEKVDQPPCGGGCTPYTPGSFLERLHVEQDAPNLIEYSIPGDDPWYWRPLLIGNEFTTLVDAFAPDVTQPADIKVRVADWHREEECRDSLSNQFRVVVRLTGGSRPDTVSDLTWIVGSEPGMVMDLEGPATLIPSNQQVLGISRPRSISPTRDQVCERLHLAWYEIFYWKRFVARGNGIFFGSPDTTAVTRYAISGFATPSLYVFDVTSQFEVKEIGGAQVSGGPVFDVAFLDTTRSGDARRYAVVAPAALLKPEELTRSQITNIRNAPGTDYCVITTADLAGPARTLSDFHHGEVVTVEQIYDEFAWGVPDATAIRDFLRWRYNQGHPFFRVLLFGDASWDVKAYLTSGAYLTYVPTYEKRYCLAPPLANPYCTDDWFVYLSPDDGDTVTYIPTIPIARIPAISADDGASVVSRTLDYTRTPDLGVWQNRIVLVADDDRVGPGCNAMTDFLHVYYSEQLNDFAYPPVFDRAKVYLTDYPLESTGLKTQARRDFLKDLNDGVLIANFVGHGDQYRLAQEEVFNPASVDLVATGKRLFFFIAASCNVSRFDDPAGSSMAEQLLRRSEGGTIGSLASTHLAYPSANQALNLNFVYALFDSARSIHVVRSIGDAVWIAKALTIANSRSNWSNDEMYTLLGDPALKLASPDLDVTVSAVEPGVLTRKLPYEFRAAVTQGSDPAPWFNGSADIRLREAEDTSGFTTCYHIPLVYEVPGNQVYRGRNAVAGGTDSFKVFMPVDAREGARGTLRCFVANGSLSGAGLLDSLVISGEAVSEDDQGPQIVLVSGGTPLASGDSIKVGDRLLVDLSDTSGVAIKAKSQFIPALSIMVDDGERQDVTDSVFAVDGDYRRSVAGFEVPSLAVGPHKFTISAFDNLNNPATVEDTLIVTAAAGQAASLVYAYPNPAADVCYIIAEYDRMVELDVTIFTVSGRKIWHETSLGPKVYHQVRWNGADADGDRVANGTYLVKVEARDPFDSSFTAAKTIAVALVR